MITMSMKRVTANKKCRVLITVLVSTLLLLQLMTNNSLSIFDKKYQIPKLVNSNERDLRNLKFKFKDNIIKDFLSSESKEITENEQLLKHHKSSKKTMDQSSNQFKSFMNSLTGSLRKTRVDMNKPTIKYTNDLSASYKSAKEGTKRHKFKPFISLETVSNSVTPITEKTLNNLMSENPIVDDDSLSKYQKSHDEIVALIDNLIDADNLDYSFYEGDGIVLLGGGEYNWYSILNIISIRRAGCKTPIEVVVGFENEYDDQFCNEILGGMNAKCVKAWEIVGVDNLQWMVNQQQQQQEPADEVEKMNLKSSVLKSVALIVSSFENVIYIDPNTMLTENLDDIFSSRVFKRYKLIQFPDFERRTTSPIYYDIIGFGNSLEDSTKLSRKRFLNDKYSLDYIHSTNYHDLEGTIPDYSTFDDIIIISKTFHLKTILLSFYYSINSNLYYNLFDELVFGDENSLNGKETLSAACNYYKLNSYQLFKRPVMDFEQNTDEWRDQLMNTNTKHKKKDVKKDADKHFVSILQHNPVHDYNNLIEILKHLEETKRSIKNYNYDEIFNGVGSKFIENKPIFVHFNEDLRQLLLNPFSLMNKLTIFGERRLSTLFPMLGFDIEQYYWRMVRFLMCENNSDVIKFGYLFDENYKNGDKEFMCSNFIDAHINSLEEHEYVWVDNYNRNKKDN